MAPGEGFGTPDGMLGYFRMVFAVEDESVLDVALERIGKVLDEVERM
jgi:aspartate/methionine/tyrosine aminotransferase